MPAAKIASKPFVQILFASTEAARKAKLVLERERSLLGLKGPIRVFYGKKLVRSAQSYREQEASEAQVRSHPTTWENHKLYFRTFHDRNQLGELLYPYRSLIQAIKCCTSFLLYLPFLSWSYVR